MPAGKLTKYVEGQKIREIHARTHNLLVDAEQERRVAAPQVQRQPRGAMSPLVVELAWEEETDLEPGSVVAIYAPLYEPADRASAPFEGVRFFARAATLEDIESGHFAITDGPIRAASGTNYSLGTGHIPAARWAQVDVADDAHTFAEPEENETILASGETGRFPILWMPAEASGVEWCVVLLAAVGTGGGTVNTGLAYIVTEVTGKTEASGTVTFGVGEAVPVSLDALGTATFDDSLLTSDPLNPGSEAGDGFKIYNFCGAPVPVGKLVHYTAHGPSYEALGGPMKFIDAEDCG